MQCYVCDRRVRPRGLRRIQNLENVTPEFREVALGRRVNNGLPQRNLVEQEVFHNYCYRQVIEEMEIDNDEDEEGIRLNCIMQRRDTCFVCGNRQRVLRRVSFQARIKVYLDKEIFILNKSFCCQEHFDENEMIREENVDALQTNIRNVVMTPKEISDWFKALRTAAVSGFNNQFANEENFSDEDFKVLTNVSKNNFRELFTYCEDVVVYDRTRSISKKDLIAFLIKLNQDLSDEFLKAVLSYTSRQMVSLIITAVRTSLSQRFVFENLGPGSITRDEFIEQHVTDFSNELYNPEPENRKAIIYVDGTYLKIPKSSNFRVLRQSYCLHKGYHLLKPTLVVAPDGFILDVHGPYFSDSRNNDAAMLQHQLENENNNDQQRLRTWLGEGDILIVDRGYRDTVDFLNNLGVETKMPPLLPRGQRQLTTEQANKARLITKTRWIVEARNGHLKSCFKFFRGCIQMSHVSHVGSFFRIACAIINRYFPSVHMQGTSVELAQAMKELADLKNVVRARIEVEGLHLQRIREDAWVNLNELGLPDFPNLSLQYLRDITIGVYQVKLAPSYIQDRLRREQVEHFTFQGMLIEHGFLRARVYSRFTQAVKHQQWIAFDPQNNEEDQQENSILGYYCTCKSGSRTVGCCSHVASVLWYLGYARHQQQVKYPSNELLHSVLDASERELPPE